MSNDIPDGKAAPLSPLANHYRVVLFALSSEDGTLRLNNVNITSSIFCLTAIRVFPSLPLIPIPEPSREIPET